MEETEHEEPNNPVQKQIIVEEQIQFKPSYQLPYDSESVQMSQVPIPEKSPKIDESHQLTKSNELQEATPLRIDSQIVTQVAREQALNALNEAHKSIERLEDKNEIVKEAPPIRLDSQLISQVAADQAQKAIATALDSITRLDDKIQMKKTPTAASNRYSNPAQSQQMSSQQSQSLVVQQESSKFIVKQTTAQLIRLKEEEEALKQKSLEEELKEETPVYIQNEDLQNAYFEGTGEDQTNNYFENNYMSDNQQNRYDSENGGQDKRPSTIIPSPALLNNNLGSGSLAMTPVYNQQEPVVLSPPSPGQSYMIRPTEIGGQSPSYDLMNMQQTPIQQQALFEGSGEDFEENDYFKMNNNSIVNQGGVPNEILMPQYDAVQGIVDQSPQVQQQNNGYQVLIQSMESKQNRVPQNQPQASDYNEEFVHYAKQSTGRVSVTEHEEVEPQMQQPDTDVYQNAQQNSDQYMGPNQMQSLDQRHFESAFSPNQQNTSSNNGDSRNVESRGMAEYNQHMDDVSHNEMMINIAPPPEERKSQELEFGLRSSFEPPQYQEIVSAPLEQGRHPNEMMMNQRLYQFPEESPSHQEYATPDGQYYTGQVAKPAATSDSDNNIQSFKYIIKKKTVNEPQPEPAKDNIVMNPPPWRAPQQLTDADNDTNQLIPQQLQSPQEGYQLEYQGSEPLQELQYAPLPNSNSFEAGSMNGGNIIPPGIPSDMLSNEQVASSLGQLRLTMKTQSAKNAPTESTDEENQYRLMKVPTQSQTQFQQQQQKDQEQMEEVQDMQHEFHQQQLYQELQNYERSVVHDMKESLHQSQTPAQTSQVVEKPEVPFAFPDPTNFLYNRFLIDQKAPQVYYNPATDDLSPRTRFFLQAKLTPQYDLVAAESAEEEEKKRGQLPQIVPIADAQPPQMSLQQRMKYQQELDRQKQNQQRVKVQQQPIQEPLQQEGIESTDDERKMFQRRLQDINRIALQYDQLSKEVEDSRTHDEQAHAEDMNETLKKNLMKVENLLADKTEQKWIQKSGNPNGVINIGAESTDQEELRRQYGPNPQFPYVEQHVQIPQQQKFPPQKKQSAQKPPVLNQRSQTQIEEEKKYGNIRPQQQNYGQDQMLRPQSLFRQSQQRQLPTEQSLDNPAMMLNIADPLSSMDDSANTVQIANTQQRGTRLSATEGNSPTNMQRIFQQQQMMMQQQQLPMVVPQQNNRPQTGLKFLRQMNKSSSSSEIANEPRQGPQLQQQIPKPPLPPIQNQQRPPLQNRTSAPNIQASIGNSRNDAIDNSGYIPRHFSHNVPLTQSQQMKQMLMQQQQQPITPQQQQIIQQQLQMLQQFEQQQPSLQLPPIKQSQQNANNVESDSQASIINIFNTGSPNDTQSDNAIQPGSNQGSGSKYNLVGGGASTGNANNSARMQNFELFERQPSYKPDKNRNDPFLIRSQLREKLYETSMLMRVDNMNLMQKVQEFEKIIKPSYYEQGLPPIIDLAQRDPTPKGSQDSGTRYSLAQQNGIQGPNGQYVPIANLGEADPQVRNQIMQEIQSQMPQTEDNTQFSQNYQQWQANRESHKTKRSGDGQKPPLRYSRSGSSQEYTNNDFIKDMMQQRMQITGEPAVQASMQSNKLPPINPGAGRNSQLLDFLKEDNKAQGKEQISQPRSTSFSRKQSLIEQPRMDSPKEQLKGTPSQEQRNSDAASAGLLQLPPATTRIENESQNSLRSHHYSSHYDEESKHNDQMPAYSVIEHIVETPKNVFLMPAQYSSSLQSRDELYGIAPQRNVEDTDHQQNQPAQHNTDIPNQNNSQGPDAGQEQPAMNNNEAAFNNNNRQSNQEQSPFVNFGTINHAVPTPIARPPLNNQEEVPEFQPRQNQGAE